jgi:succinate dehydrogenase/fumarate reductase-like Fe-S protein
LYVIPDIETALDVLPVSEAYKRLIGCLECYGCMATCPQFDWRDETFGGPYIFVRLALLHLDPRDREDRQAQARALGIEKCVNCSACRCVKGIAIRKEAVGILLDETTTHSCPK